MFDENNTGKITATEFKLNLGKYLDYVIDGHDLIVTKNGKDAIYISPYAPKNTGNSFLAEKAADYLYDRMKVSYEEFVEIYEKNDLRMEYINGEIYVLSSPNIFHQSVSGNLYVIINNYLKGKKCRVFYSPFDILFFKKDGETPDVMQPDLFIACDVDENINEKGKYTGTPTLVIEILSSGTRSKDMVLKLNSYMMSGVREYWIFDPDKMKATVYSFKDYEIDELNTYKKGQSFESHNFEGLKIELDAIFEF